MARRDYPPDQTLNWTPRQRQVLDLLARGKTNAEIAETLGVTLAGAKWHVSEVISKLGVESREQAADYWREQNTVGARFGRALHAFTAFMTVKTIGGGVAAAAVGAVAVGAVIVAADSGDDEPNVALEATPTHAPPAPTATQTPEGFVAEVPAPAWWIPPRDIPGANSPCATGWDEAVGYAYLEVPGNEYYWVVQPSTSTAGSGQKEIACVRHAGRVSYHWDAAGNLVESGPGGSAGGGSFEAKADSPPSCGYSGPSGSLMGQNGLISLPIECSVPLNVAYANVDDGVDIERFEALDMPTVLGFPRKALVAAHSSTTGFVIEFFAADGTLVDRQDFTMPGQVEATATPTGFVAGPSPAPDDPALYKPADVPSSSPSSVPAVQPPDWFTSTVRDRVTNSPVCASGWDSGIGVAHVESEGEERYLVFLPDSAGSYSDPDRICWRGYDSDSSIEQSSFRPGSDENSCNYSSGGPNPHWVLCNVSTDVAYAVFDDGTTTGAAATELPTTLGIDRRIILTTHTSPDGSMTVHFYDDNDVLIDTFYRPPNPG